MSERSERIMKQRDRGWHPPSRPRPVADGIKARSKRGSIGQQWWSRRFIDVLESCGVGGRLSRGRSYARKGQIRELTIEPGVVRAPVQGSRPQPYRVRIAVRRLTDDEWRRVERELAGQALYRATLLAGEMPPEIEEVFAGCGAPLFPAAKHDLDMSCSCPDWEVPCKHLAAVCYLLGEAFDDDPFLMLAWRGRDREHLLAQLRELADATPDGATGAGAGVAGAGASAGQQIIDVTNTPLKDCLDDYWSPRVSLARLHARPTTPPSAPDLLLRTLEPPPITVRRHNLVDILTPVYVAMTTPPE
jgi:uncharacterized Zn finger protein